MEDSTPVTKKNQIVLISLCVILFLVIAFIVYKLFFEFDNSTVTSEVATAANNDPGTIIIINDGIKHILASTYLTQQVLDYSTMSSIPKEQVLVNTAVAMAKNAGYIQ